jgi:hypothetical protein
LNAPKTYKISSLGIDTNAFVQLFPRERHSVGDLRDNVQSYFGDRERLTTSELMEIENWPDTVNDLFVDKGIKGAKDNFLRCSRGDVGPETPIEKIITKLIHQALAMGGLHCLICGDETPIFHFPRDLPLNDIVDLKALPLRKFLLEAQKEMVEYAKKEWEQTFGLAMQLEMKIGLEDSEYIREDEERYQAEVSSDLASDAECFANSNEEGWFYSDSDYD